MIVVTILRDLKVTLESTYLFQKGLSYVHYQRFNLRSCTIMEELRDFVEKNIRYFWGHNQVICQELTLSLGETKEVVCMRDGTTLSVSLSNEFVLSNEQSDIPITHVGQYLRLAPSNTSDYAYTQEDYSKPDK